MEAQVPSVPATFVGYQPAGHPLEMPRERPARRDAPLRLLFWETTKACNLKCQHCRAVPEAGLGPNELTTKEAFTLIDQIAEVSKPVLVLSGGEPLYRPDIFDIGAKGLEAGFRMALATNGTLVTKAVAKKIKDTGFSRVAISMDGAVATTHDRFRGLPGSYEAALTGIRNLREQGVSVQINSTVAKHNVHELPDLLRLALRETADALHIFMLVPVGCGLEIADREMLPADEYERVLHWFYDESKQVPIDLKATCAPHYFRVRAQRIMGEREHGDRSTPFIAHGTKAKAAPGLHGGQQLSAMTRGCLAGSAVCFVSNVGSVYPCGYLPVSAGSIRHTPFKEIWTSSPVFQDLRDPDALTGKCGICRYEAICTGCRARAYAATGDYLAEEPFCNYDPLTEA